MDKCPTVELGVQETHLRGKKKKIQSISFSSKFQKSKKGMYPLKRAKVTFTIVITIITIHLSFATHAHLDLTYWLVLLLAVYHLWAPDIKSLIRVGWKRRQCHHALYHKYFIFWEKAYTITALVRIQKYHKREIWESHTRNLWVLFENLQKLQSYS